MVFAMQECLFQVIQDHLILYTSAILKLHLRSAILSLILHCIVPDQVTRWLVKQQWNPWNETFFFCFFFREFGRRIPLLKVMVPGWRCGFSPWTILVQLKNIERQISISDFFGFPDKTLKSLKKCNIHTYSINKCYISINMIHAHSVMYIDELYVFARLRKKDNMFVTCQL